MIRTHQLGLALALTTAALTAQTSAPAGILPAKPLASLHIDGPAALRTALLPTNLGRMFAGPEFKEMMAPLLEMFAGLKEQAGGEMPIDLDRLERGFLNYRGRMAAGFYLLDDKIDFQAPTPPDFMLVVVLTPDGHTNLASIARKAKDMGGNMLGDKLAEVTCHGKAIQFVDQGHDPSISLPFMHQEHLVLLLSSNMEIAGDLFLNQEGARHTAEAKFASSSIGLSIHASRIVELAKAGAAENPNWAAMGSHLFRRIGIESLEAIDITYRAHGPALLSEAVVNFNQNDRGILGVLMPSDPKKCTLLDILPPQAMQAGAIPFDMKKVFQIIKATFADLGDNSPMSFEDMLENFKEEFELDLKADVFDLFGNGLISLSMESEGGSGGPLASVEGMTIGFDMADGKKFATSLDKMLRQAGMHAGRQKSEYKGYEVYALNIAMFLDLRYTIADSLFMIGVGDASEDAIHAVLDQLKRRSAGEEATPLAQSIRNRLKMVPGGWTGMGWTDVEGSLYKMLDQLDMISSQIPPEFGSVFDILEKLPTLLKKYAAEHQVAVVRTEAMRWVYQNIW